MQKIILIHVTGSDRPGLIAQLTSVLAEYGVPILDIGQVVIHHFLTLGILIRIPEGAESAPILKDLLFRGHELGVTMRLHPLSPERYEQWVDGQGRPRSIVTVLARTITGEHVARVAEILAAHGLNIDAMHRLSGRVPLSPRKPMPRQACVEFSVRGVPADGAALRADLMAVAAGCQADIAYQEDNLYRRNRRLVAFDMDSTLISTEVIDELARRYGVGGQVSAITESAMRGELDFRQSLRRRLALLKGMPESVLADVAAQLPLSDGAERLIKALKHIGYKIAIISGGFTYFGEHLARLLGIDYVFANRLEIRHGALTGRVEGDIVDAARKATILTDLARREKISLQQVIAVGDGANDLPMLGLAGLGIAFHAKPKVRAGAGHAISSLGLDSILYLVGMRDRDLAEHRLEPAE